MRRRRRRGKRARGKNGAVFVKVAGVKTKVAKTPPSAGSLLGLHLFLESASSTGRKKGRHSHSRTRRGSAGAASERPSMSKTEKDA